MENVIELQRTEDWFNDRLGKVTASRIADVMAKTKTGYGASRANYMAQLIAETLTGNRIESFTNAAMQWGTETEPQAKGAYEFITDNKVIETGFIDHPIIENSGASPDGLIGENGLIEIKCPNTATHINTLLTKKIDKKYQLQMQWQMACTGRNWCDFVSFDPRMPDDMNIWISRVERDDELLADIHQEIGLFMAEMKSKIEQLKTL